MPIATLTEVKTLLRIGDSSLDTYIAAVIPWMQDYISDWCNNYFEYKTDEIYIESSKISFENADPDTITDEDETLVEAGFVDGMDIRIAGSLYNDKTVLVDTVVAAKFTLDSNEELIAEDEDLAILITWVKFPKGLKVPFAKTINYLIQQSTTPKAVSERVGNESYTFKEDRSKAIIPEALMNEFKRWKRPHIL